MQEVANRKRNFHLCSHAACGYGFCPIKYTKRLIINNKMTKYLFQDLRKSFIKDLLKIIKWLGNRNTRSINFAMNYQ